MVKESSSRSKSYSSRKDDVLLRAKYTLQTQQQVYNCTVVCYNYELLKLRQAGHLVIRQRQVVSSITSCPTMVAERGQLFAVSCHCCQGGHLSEANITFTVTTDIKQTAASDTALWLGQHL